MTGRILTTRGVLAKLPFGRSTLFAKISRGEFPQPYHFGKRRLGFDETLVDAYIAAHAPKPNQME